MRRNAMNDADKVQRRRTFLDAAHRLYGAHRVLPSVADIAAAAGLAKGTVYRYFGSKEEIFVALLEDDFNHLFAALLDILAALPPAADKAAQQFARRYTHTILSLPDLMPLAALANSILEQNLEADVLRQFKTGLASGLTGAGKLLEDSYPSLKRGHGATLLLHTYALTVGLWQALNYPDALRALLSEPALRPLDRQFDRELAQAICTLWLGALAHD